MKKKRRKLKKKVIYFLILLGIIVTVSLLIYLFKPKSYGYSKEAINTFREENLYNEILEKKKYSKTLDVSITENKFKKEYFEDYLNINYIDNNDFIDNINLMLSLGYKSDDINTFYEVIPNSIEVIINNKYDKDVSNYLKLDYFKEENLKRYIDYDLMEVKSVYDITGIKNDYNYEDTVTFVNANLDKPYYEYDTNLTSEEASKIDVIVNKYHKLDSKYEPDDLEVIDSKYASGRQRLRKEAKEKFELMASDMASNGLKIYAGSTYRSYDYQLGLYNRYVKKDGFNEAETYSARAGYSEHQLGLAVDIVNSKWDYLSENDKEYDYLVKNSYKYGFILRYPRGSEYITGYIFEDWHFRYLGVSLATKVHDSNLTYDEYIARGMLKEK